MNKLDLILLVPFLWGLIRGFIKGFIIQLAGIAAFLLGLLGAIHFSDFMAAFLQEHMGWHYSHTQLWSFAITFLAIVLLVFFLAKLMEKAVKIAALGLLNKITGALFGALKFVLITGALLYFVSSFENRFRIIPSKTQQGSVLYSYYIEGIKLIVPAIRKVHS